MKSHKIVAYLLVLLAPIALSAKPTEKLPAFSEELTNVDNKKLKLSDIKGKNGTLVIFGCNHCPFVKSWIDRIVNIGNETASKGVGVVMINSNDPEYNEEDGFTHMQALAKEKGMKFPYVVDQTSQAARVFGATRTPEAFLFDPKGSLVYHGAIDDNADDEKKVSAHYLRNAVRNLVDKKPINPKQTKFIGCTIKMRKKKG